MKLGILCTMLNGFGKKGYYNTQEVGVGRQLVKEGHHVLIYKGVPATQYGEIVSHEIEPHLNITYIPMKGLGVHGYLNTSLLDRDLDGILCFSDNQLFLPHVIRFSKRNNIKYVPYFGTTFSVYKTLRGKVMNALFRTFVVPYYRKMPVMAKTKGACRELYALGIRNVTIASAGMDFSMLRQDYREYDRDKIRKEMGYGPEDVILFSVARMELDKRPGDMIEILNKVKNRKRFRLLIVGKGPLRKSVDQKISAYKLDDRVKILESVPYHEMWKMYRIADYFLNLNKEEIFGMAVMEAVCYGVPVVAFRAPGPSTTLKEMKGHCLCDNDNEIAETICKAYPGQKELKESALKMRQEFSWEKCAKAFVQFVEET